MVALFPRPAYHSAPSVPLRFCPLPPAPAPTPMASRKRTLKWLLPLWVVAALLFTAGWYAHAQQPDTAPAVADPPAAQPNAPAATGQPPEGDLPASVDTPRSGIADRPGSPVIPGGEDITAGERAAQARAQAEGGTWTQRGVSLLGLMVFTFLAYLLSVNRAAAPWRLVAWGLALQFIFAVLILKFPFGKEFFEGANDVFNALIAYTIEGARFLVGNLVNNNVPVGPADGPMAPVTSPSGWANTGA